MAAGREQALEADAAPGQPLAETDGEPGVVPVHLKILTCGRLAAEGLAEPIGLLGPEMPPEAKQQRTGGGDRVDHTEIELFRCGSSKLEAAMVAGAEPIEAIVAAFDEAAAVGEAAAGALAWLGLAAGAEPMPDLHGLDPVDRAFRRAPTELQHVVSRT